MQGLQAWNEAAEEEAQEQMLSCCGSPQWAWTLVRRRPYGSVEALLTEAEAVWFALPEAEWLTAFACHPRIGERKAEVRTTAQFADWSGNEQGSAQATLETVAVELIEGNRQYEEKFGFLYIVFASGRTAPELLSILKERLGHDREAELLEAAEQQWRIAKLRLTKLVAVQE